MDPTKVDDPVVATQVQELFDEAADAVEVVRRLWDSWEDDAIIKDVPTGRYIDRDKLHYIDFEGRFFRVKGPSIVPRPPQGNPLIAALAHSRIPFEFAARSADVVFITPRDADDVRRWVGDVRAAARAVARTLDPLKIFADLVVFLDRPLRPQMHASSISMSSTEVRFAPTQPSSSALPTTSPISCSPGRPTVSTASGSGPE